ncbi:MAG: 1-deoxy-D-xylulose-5-phosphate reductoisomerase [Candidatus Latescibacteria bacterium]|nr:1-deoxy-D-xylulose-5-phosphate reductoisomerase [Candidatus Latescibacterota bacterium]
MKRVAILGSTGSIGVQSLEVIAQFPDRFTVCGLTANSQTEMLQRQIERFRPDIVAVMEERYAEKLRQTRNGYGPALCAGLDGLIAVATHPEADLVISALPGSAGLIPTLRAIQAEKTIALANKEILVMAGELVMRTAAAAGAQILPIDSEHCAIHQCLAGQRIEQVERLILTCSGGPFRDVDRSAFASISPADALAHPVWEMGRKVTIDSATLMNKGFEVIEAHWLFGLPVDRIDIVIHPQSIIHSMVEMVDGSILAQLGVPDMRLPIQYALTFPERLNVSWQRLDLMQRRELTFAPPDFDKFPCLRLAYQAGQAGVTVPTVLSTADEVAVEAFLQARIGFSDIPDIIAETITAHEHRMDDAPNGTFSLPSILEADVWARAFCADLVNTSSTNPLHVS